MVALCEAQQRVGKPLLFVLCLLPFGLLAWAAVSDSLGPDPVKTLIHTTGEWSIRFLLITLAVSPLRDLSKAGWVLRYRRMLGLYAWFYTSLHLLIVATYLFGWDWAITKEELSERPYIIAGFLAWVLMVPLGLTSNNWAVRRLRQNWRRLHKLVYLAAGLAWLHIAWQTRSSYFDAVFYAALLLILFLPRIKKLVKNR